MPESVPQAHRRSPSAAGNRAKRQTGSSPRKNPGVSCSWMKLSATGSLPSYQHHLMYSWFRRDPPLQTRSVKVSPLERSEGTQSILLNLNLRFLARAAFKTRVNDAARLRQAVADSIGGSTQQRGLWFPTRVAPHSIGECHGESTILERQYHFGVWNTGLMCIQIRTVLGLCGLHSVRTLAVSVKMRPTPRWERNSSSWEASKDHARERTRV